MTDTSTLTATEIAEQIKRGALTAEESVAAAFARIDQVNDRFNAVVTECREEAIAEAVALDRHISSNGTNAAGQLAGVPITVKVNIDQKGYPTTNGVRLQKELMATTDSPLISNLKAAGAIIVGRTNTPAFSIRWFTRNSLHGATINPLNPALTPGGSSGGAAAAVAAGMGAIAHGTDIAGSIRYPAYACGLHGLRPSLGRIPVHNASGEDRLPAGQLMAVSGPLARTVEDLRLAFHAMAGGDAINQGGSAINARDPWWVPVPLKFPATEKRAALLTQPADTPLVNAHLVDALHQAAKKLEAAGWAIEEVQCPDVAEAARLNMQFWMVEMDRTRDAVKKENDPDANFIFEQLERYAQSYGFNSGKALDATASLFQQRASLVRRWQEFLQQYPLLLCPPSAELPFEDHIDVRSESDFDRVFNAQLLQIGLPSIGVPALHVTTGHVTAENTDSPVPVGVQLVGRRFREDVLLDAGELLQMPAKIVG